MGAANCPVHSLRTTNAVRLTRRCSHGRSKCLLSRSEEMSPRRKFAADPRSQIRRLIDQGLTPSEIAKTIGCTLGTLRVQCSKLGISLRDQSRDRAAQRIRDSQKTHQYRPVTVSLPANAIDAMKRRASADGLSLGELAAILLQVIAEEDLYSAVLDGLETTSKAKREIQRHI